MENKPLSIYRKRVLLPAAVALTVLAAGCAQSGDGPKETADTPSGAATPAAGQETKPAELVFYSTSADTPESFNARFGDKIREKFPQYTIKYIQAAKGTLIDEMVLSGTKFDIFFASVGNYEDALLGYDLQYDMSGLIQQFGIDLNRFEPTSIEGMRAISGGNMYGLPVFNNSMVLYYNKDLFNKFGVNPPKDGMTWDETMELAKKLNRQGEDGKPYIGFSTSPNHIIRMNPFSLPNAEPQTDVPTINRNEGWKQLFDTVFVRPAQEEFFKARMLEKKQFPGRTVDPFVKDQYAAMYAYLQSFPLINTEQLKALNWDMVSFPTFASMPGVGAQAYPSYFGITNMSQNKEAAMNVLRYLTSDEFQLAQSKQGIMSALDKDDIKRALGTESPFKDKHFGAVYVNKFAPMPKRSVYDPKLFTMYMEKSYNIAAGTVDMNSGLRAMEEEANRIIAAEKQKRTK